MRLSSSKLAWLLSFLTGLFWAMIFVGFFKGLIENWNIGIIYAFATAFFWAIPGVLGVVFVEFIINSFEQKEILKEQTKLLKELLAKENRD